MKFFSDSFTFSTRGEFDFVDLSGKVNNIIKKSGIQEGLALIYAGHATGAIVITEYEHDLKKDIQDFLQKLIPSDRNYHHPANAFAHLRSMILTPSKMVPIKNRRLSLGTWQSVFWVETERRSRNRKVEVHVVGNC